MTPGRGTSEDRQHADAVHTAACRGSPQVPPSRPTWWRASLDRCRDRSPSRGHRCRRRVSEQVFFGNLEELRELLGLRLGQADQPALRARQRRDVDPRLRREQIQRQLLFSAKMAQKRFWLLHTAEYLCDLNRMQAIFIAAPQVAASPSFTGACRFATTLVVSEPLVVRFALGDVVRKLRKSAGLGLRDLAKKAAVDYTSAWRLENKSDRSERRTIARIATALKTTEAELYAWADLLSTLGELVATRRESVLLFARRQLEAQAAADHEQIAEADPHRSAPVRESQSVTIRKRQPG